jgi:hypothetical protein
VRVQSSLTSRFAVLTIVVSAALTLPPLTPAQSAIACSCAAASDPGAQARLEYDAADVVFAGRVVKERVHRVATYSPDGMGVSYSGYVNYRIKPSRVYKGYVHSPQRVRFGGLGSSCESKLPGQGPFLIFANKPSADDAAKFTKRGVRAPVYSGACSGSRKFDPAKVPYGPGRPG